MFRLGVRLTLRSGREALVRLVVTAAAVAIGVAIMLAVLADFHAFVVTGNRPFWEGTRGVPVSQASASSRSHRELWNYSDEVFRGQTIERLDVSALGPGAPIPPGISRLPAAGRYYASPALARLIRSAPRDELGARFAGSQAGTIGHQALTGPGELVIYVGDSAGRLASLPNTVVVSAIATGPGKQVWSSYFRDAFIVGALAFLLPILILIGTATKLASARREERYAALRLVGASVSEINAIATADAIVSGALGAVAGIGIFALIRPILASTAITSARYFAGAVTPTVAGYLSVLVAVPAAAAVASLLALRRVRISPLGVSRKVSPPPPSAWRLLPLGVGVLLFVAGMLLTTAKSIGAPALPGLLVIMIGLVVGGPYLTARAARLLPASGTASSIFASRRLTDNPKAAFRSVSGLVLAVFLGTVVAGLLPAINATTATPSARALGNVLLAGFMASPTCGNTVNCTGNVPGPQFGGLPGSMSHLSPLQKQAAEGLPPAQGARLVRELRRFRRATTVPIYSRSPGASVVSCPGMRAIGALGECAPGVQAVAASTFSLYGDNPTYTTEAIVGQGSPAFHGSLSGLYLQAVLVKVQNTAVLERVRTFLITHTANAVSGSAPRTFGEAVQARLDVATVVQRLVDVAVALTLLVAGCSLAVVVGGGLVERKRPFAMLRLSGTPTATLYRVVLLEAIMPLVAAALVAMGTAYGLCLLVVRKMAPAGTPLPVLGHTFYLTLGIGLAGSLLVILATFPVLGRITSVENVRFE
jgi:hypothetical protein